MPRSLAGSIRKGSDYMSEEEKTPTTGLEDTSPGNGMGGVSENSGGVSPEESPKKKRGRPKKIPGDPNNKPSTIGEYIAQNPSIAEQISLNTRLTTTYPSNLTADEIVARDIDRHMEIMALPRVNINSLEEMQGRYAEYMQICRKYGKRMTVAGFAESLGCTRQVLWHIATGRTTRSQGIVDFVNFVLTSINAELEDLMVSNRINPVSGIFLLKQSGYKDNVDLTISTAGTVEKTEEELAAEYIKSIPTVDE